MNTVALFATLLAAAGASPNIFLIVADDLGWNDIGYNNPEIWSPQLDELAATGIKLTDYHVYKVCSPTRASFMTGRLPNRAGLQDFISHDTAAAISREYTLLPAALKAGGYKTHMVGKWHLGYWDWPYIPSNRGFDTTFGYMTGAEEYWLHTNGKNCTGLDLTFCVGSNLTAQPQFNGTYSTYMYMHQITELIRLHDKTAPLFLYLPFQSVHEPIEAPDAYINMYPANYANATNGRRIFAGMVTALDDAVGNVTTSLKLHGLWDNSLLIFSTDNGGNLGAAGNNLPLRGGKFTFWEGGTRGVGFVSGPLVPAHLRGTASGELVHACDWYATLLDVAGIARTAVPGRWTAIDSISLKEVILNGGKSPRTSIVHTSTKGLTNGTAATGKIRSGPWNLYLGNPGYGGYPVPGKSNKNVPDPTPEICNAKPCLFDLSDEDGTHEHTDVHDQHPDVVAQLLKELGAAAWDCPDGLCTLDTYAGTATACDSLKAYGSFGPWASLSF